MNDTIITVSGMNDAERTESLKAQLQSVLNHSPMGYEWHNGEPLYHGQPTYAFFAKQHVYFRERTAEEQNHANAMEAAFGSHGQG